MKFVKMHGAGNDFLLTVADGSERDWSGLAVAMCERHFGVGADGLMLVLPSRRADVGMRLFNADGSEAEVSGNGVRCLVKLAVERGLAKPSAGIVSVEAIHDVLQALVVIDRGSVKSVQLSMGPPKFAPAEVPVLTERQPPVIDMPMEVGGRRLAVTCLSMGNPHAVHFTDGPVGDYPLESIGPLVERHPAFPQRVNFGVARMISPERMDVRVWERGVGETLACGSGCCAAMVAARLQGRAGNRVDITQPGGVLTVEWEGSSSHMDAEVLLSGGAEFVFEGDWPGA